MKRIVLFITAGCLILTVIGCENNKDQKQLILNKQIDQLQVKNDQLQTELKHTGEKNQQLQEQVQTLSALDPNIRLENLYELKKIKIGRFTGFSDRDKDGKKEKFIVYIQPIDENEDIIKASGTVDVQLWDLNKHSGDAMLAEWKIGPAELKKMWFATTLTINYRLVFDAADLIKDRKDPLTVKVTFTDYLTGKVFQEQKVVKP